MRCSRCLNTDEKFFYRGSNGWYCRKCVKFQGEDELDQQTNEVDPEYYLNFSLTNKQAEISHQLTKHVREGQSVLLEAVCGAGKTEIIFEMIADNLRNGKKVGISIARRQVVLEIAERLQAAFKNLKVVAVCQGHTKDVNGDLIVCTTHQLYRYRQYFDTLVIDEPDAFPFKGNSTLQGIAKNSCRGAFVYLTATPDDELKNNKSLKKLYLSKRPHGHDLCVPDVLIGPKLFLIFKGALWLMEELKQHKKVLLFVPNKKTGRNLYQLMKIFINCCHIDSESEDRDRVIKDFKNDKYDLCISTSVLERGITISNVQVLVWLADSGVFDEAALTQIAGRVGRNKNYPDGECLFLCNSRQRSVEHCIESIVRANND